MEYPRLRSDIRIDRYFGGPGQLVFVISDVLLNGRDVNAHLYLPPLLWHVARFCDGQSDFAAIADKVRSHAQARVGTDLVKQMVHLLDSRYLLDNERSRERLGLRRSLLQRVPVRKTTSRFLPKRAAVLRTMLERCAAFPLGPGASAAAPAASQTTSLTGAVCPHADLKVSGPCAAHVYAALEASPIPDAVIVAGYNHIYGANTIEILLKDAHSPLGLLKVARKFGEAVCVHAGDALSRDGMAIYHEHSIDMQIPWLQYIAEKRKHEILYLPIILSNVPKRADVDLALGFRDKIKRVALAVRKAARQLNQRICIIASGDFAHAGPYYGGEPVTSQSVGDIMTFDNRAIQMILDGNADRFYRMTVGTTYCCTGPVYFLLKAIEWNESKLLKYYTTWDLGKPAANINSFASISFQR